MVLVAIHLKKIKFDDLDDDEDMKFDDLDDEKFGR